MDALSAELVRRGLGTAFVGRDCVYYGEIGSTNEEARRLASQGAREGTLVISDYQIAGRGRLDRRWEASRGSSLLFSLVLRPALDVLAAPLLTMVCGLAVMDAIWQTNGLKVGLKWPNDIVRDDAKLGGILTEIEVHAERVEHAVLGIGLNVNVTPSELPEDLLVPATSVSHELGRCVERLDILQEVLRSIEERYMALLGGLSPHQEWADKLVTLGKSVRIACAGDSDIVGIAEGVGPDGALVIRQADGTLVRALSGDVMHGYPAVIAPDTARSTEKDGASIQEICAQGWSTVELADAGQC